MAMTDAQGLDARVAELAARNFNAFDFVLVSVPGDASPPVAHLEVHFLTSNRLPTVLASNAPPKSRFTVSGGHRVRAGEAPGEVQVVEVAAVVAGSLPLAPTGLTGAETLTVRLGGASVDVALAAGAGIGDVVDALNAAFGAAGMKASARAVDGRLTIAAHKSFDLTVSSSRADPGDGGGSGFDTVPKSPPADVLNLVVRPIGDYSTYTLSVGPGVAGFDPVFDELGFKFRPGCFSTDCAPEWKPPPPPVADPPIDYLAKDYDSFRHLLMAWMEKKVPGWQPTSEADLSQMLLSLFSAAADELSDFQDRVMNEAYLATARSRVSLARHARLMDYHVHQGNQTSTRLALKLAAGQTIEPGGDDPAEIEVWAGRALADDESVIFRGLLPHLQHLPNELPHLHHLLNELPLYTWSGARPGLEAGDTEADLAVGSQADAVTMAEWIGTGKVPYLLIQEHRDPLTGNPADADPEKRQLLALDPEAVKARKDPLTDNKWYVHVAWREEDRLRYAYCGTVETEGASFERVSLFHGNLTTVFQGRRHEVVFRAPGQVLTAANERHYEPTQREGGDGRPLWGTLCRLPDDTPLLYRSTPPRSDVPPVSTLAVEVDGALWSEVVRLVGSDDTDRHFAVETDELGRSVLRFGNGIHGENLPTDAVVRCVYQTGRGLDGNVGGDRVSRFDAGMHPKVEAVWNPFDVTDGRAPEPREVILRNVPEAYRTRQQRAVTLADYAARAEEVPEISRASARYAWTGSWRTVRVTLDPAGTDRLRPVLRAAVARHLEPLRLIGEDLELRAPVFVPLVIDVALCVNPEVWPEDVAAVLEQEFSDGYTPDGRQGLFHPDLWSFGQTLYASQILGRLERVPGVDHALSVTLARFDSATPGTGDRIEVAADEIIQVRNDPDHMERGSITFEAMGRRG